VRPSSGSSTCAQYISSNRNNELENTRPSSPPRGYPANQGIADARITLDERPPIQDGRSGKLRQVTIERRGVR